MVNFLFGIVLLYQNIGYPWYTKDDYYFGKDLFGHTPVGLFIGRLLVFFSVLYHSIGEISGIFKILPEFGWEIFLEILKPFRIGIQISISSGKVRMMVKLE
jgi:hypothetical protein